MTGDHKETSKQNGLYQWDEIESNITLDQKADHVMYKVAENRLILLDKQGNLRPLTKTANYILIQKTNK
jgi:hypothetical protein